jgi:hypothetical protein
MLQRNKSCEICMAEFWQFANPWEYFSHTRKLLPEQTINKDNIRGFKCVIRMSAKPASVATHPAAGNFDLTAGRRRA